MVNYLYVIFYDFMAGIQLPGFWVVTLCRAVHFVGSEELTASHV
jgi:hypothetical protein